jgi:hypothetical protein
MEGLSVKVERSMFPHFAFCFPHFVIIFAAAGKSFCGGFFEIKRGISSSGRAQAWHV